MAVIIPMFADPNYVESIKLDDKYYKVSFRWNSSEEAWYMAMRMGTDFGFITKLVQGIDLLKPYNYHQDAPRGELWCVAEEERLSFSSVDSENRSAFLMYFSENELKPYEMG
jgi:hypothetical protein